MIFEIGHIYSKVIEGYRVYCLLRTSNAYFELVNITTGKNVITQQDEPHMKQVLAAWDYEGLITTILVSKTVSKRIEI